MMMLVKTNKGLKIISSVEINYYFNQGWKIIKPLPDLPTTIKKISAGIRSPEQIAEWYNIKIKQHREEADRYSKELAKFRRMVK